MKKISLLSLCVLLISQPSLALFELKAGYGILSSKPDLSNFYGGTLPSAAPNAGLTFDAIATIPFVGLGAGLRYENMKISTDNSNLDVENQLTRTALIVNYRLLNTLIYLGPIMTYGLSHSNGIRLRSGGTDLSKISSNDVSSYSIGVEAGASLLGFLVGAELGTMTMKYKDAKDSINTSQSGDLDMSGTYAKIFIGFGI